MNIKQAQLPKGDALSLPKGWEIKQWKDVLDIKSGRNQTQVENPKGKYPILGSAGKIMGSANDFICDEGTTIVGRKGTIDNPLFIESKFWNVDTAFGLHALDGLNKRFLFYFCRSYDFTKQDKGSGRPSLVKSDLQLIKMPIPTLPEQQHIVAILDETFAAIARAKTNAEQNLKNSKELFDSYLQNVFETKGEGWEEKTLGEVLLKTESIDPTKKPDEEFIYLDVSSVNKETKEIENASSIMGKNAPSRARKLIRTNDVIFATVRPTHSRVALITEEYNEQVCSTGYFVLRAKDFLNNNLVFYFLLTYGFNKQMEKLQKGASYPAVNDSDVKGIIIPFPKLLKEQQSIVQKLDALSAETKKLEAIYQQKINDLEELKKSVLQKAFNGELTSASSVLKKEVIL